MLIRDSNILLGNPSDIMKTHKIDALWQATLDVLKKIAPLEIADNNKELAMIEQLIMELSSVDPDSMTFRYPVDNKQQPILDEEKQIIYTNVSSKVYAVSLYLESIASRLIWFVEPGPQVFCLERILGACSLDQTAHRAGRSWLWPA